MGLLFLGHRYFMITVALVAAFFGVIKNTARPKPGGTELTHNADQAQRRPEFAVGSNGKGKGLGQCPSAYSSSPLSCSSISFLLRRNPCVLPLVST